MNAFLQDVRYSFRTLWRNPAFASVAVLTLALGIGANTAIFSVVNGVLLKPLEYRQPERLVFIASQFPTLGFDEFWVSPPEYRELQQNMRSFSDIGAWRTGSVSLSGIDTPVRVPSAVASAELFRTLGVSPELGRTFTPEEDTEGGSAVAVISHELWTRVYGQDAKIIGRTIEADGSPRSVVGVMPAGFDVQGSHVDVWQPLALPPSPTNRGSHFLNLIGRLAPESTVDGARAELGGLLGRWGEISGNSHAPNDSTHQMVLTGLQERTVGDARPALIMLLGAVGLVLLIACANVANLLLARAATREGELAVRAALGAGRGRLVRLFLAESGTIAAVGGTLGLFIGWAGVKLLVGLDLEAIPRADAITLDSRVLLFTLALTAGTGLLFGLAPLVSLSRGRMNASLRQGGQRSTATGSRKRLRRALVIGEIALAVGLVIGSGLLLRSFAALQRVDTGFRTEDLITFEIYMPGSRYEDGVSTAALLARLRGRLAELPGVTAVSAMSGLPPLRDLDANDTDFEGKQQTPDGPAHNVDYWQVVDGPYFEAMGVPIRQGRAFDATDDAAATPVAIISEKLARTFYPGENPIGKRIKPSWIEPWMTTVGIAEDVKQGGIPEQAGTEMYFHFPQVGALFDGEAQRTMNLVLRTPRTPELLGSEIRRVVGEIDPALPVAHLQSMEANVASTLGRPRFLATLLTLFAVLALTLAAIGTYGVLSYAVAERNKEIGIRMALGAEGRRVLGMVMRDGLFVTAAGVVLGLLGAFAATRLMRSLLFEVGSTDALTFIAAPLVLIAVAVVAAYLPARRATRVDPMVALRAE